MTNDGWSRRSLRVGDDDGESMPALDDLDGITDPQLLAHALLQVDTEAEEHGYAPRLRCSSLHQVCVRERLIGFRENLKNRSYNGIGLQVTFDIGNAVHFYLQNSPRYFRDMALGWWECMACGHRYFGRRRKKKCPDCGAHPRAFFYKEHFLKLDEPYLLSGHTDDLLEVHRGDARVTEFKTINGDEFDRLTGPLANHVIQVTGYLMGLPHDRNLPIRVNPDKALILYVSKAMKVGKFPMKAYHVRKSAPVVDAIEKDLEEFKRGMEDRSYLPDPMEGCRAAAFKAGRAKWCPARTYCERAA